MDPSPVARLARAIAVGKSNGAEAGLSLVEAILDAGELVDYLPAHSARADLCRQLRRPQEALTSYRRALSLAQQEPERRFLLRRITELGG
jgi:RNA polymerase sigma-70 factor (ECF subfamily)